MYELTIKVTIFEDDLEEAKAQALDYLHQIAEINDDELTPIAESKEREDRRQGREEI